MERRKFSLEIQTPLDTPRPLTPRVLPAVFPAPQVPGKSDFCPSRVKTLAPQNFARSRPPSPRGRFPAPGAFPAAAACRRAGPACLQLCRRRARAPRGSRPARPGAGSSRRGAPAPRLPFPPGESAASSKNGFSLRGAAYRLGKRTRRHNCLLSRRPGSWGAGPGRRALGFLPWVGEFGGANQRRERVRAPGLTLLCIGGGSPSDPTAFLSEDLAPSLPLSYWRPGTETFKCRFRNSLSVLETLKGGVGSSFISLS